MITLSIRQPWAWLIVNGYKDIENRDWYTNRRGKVLIHASKGMTKDEYYDCCDFLKSSLPEVAKIIREQHSHLENGFSWEYLKNNFCGGVVGEAEIIDCIKTSQSKWFFGQYGFVLRNAKPTKFMPCKGKLGFFEIQTESGV